MWTARRLAISAFLIGHMGAVSIWVLPPCPIQRRCAGTLAYYILPLGLWQYWGMFAPDPVRDTLMLEAEVIDVRGIRYNFAFPKLADYSAMRGDLPVPPLEVRGQHGRRGERGAARVRGAARDPAARPAGRRLPRRRPPPLPGPPDAPSRRAAGRPDVADAAAPDRVVPLPEPAGGGAMNPLRAWNTFWFGPISARPLGAFRIAFGVVALANLALLTADFDHWFTDAGLLHGTEAREAAGPLRLSPLQWVQDPTSVRVAFGATAIVAVLFTLGWRTRLMGVGLYLGMLSIHHRNVSSACGADVLLMILAFYLMLSPCGAAYSLDARRASRKRGTLAEPLIVPWAQRLIQLQLCLVYFNTAVLKAHGSTWLDGTDWEPVTHVLLISGS